MTTTIQPSLGTVTSLTWSAAIASSTTACRESNAITIGNNVNLAVFGTVVFPNSAAANDKTLYFLVGGYYGASAGWQGSPALTGSDAAWTADADLSTNPSGLIMARANWQVQNKTRSFVIPNVAECFGGNLPEKVGLVAWNYSGQTITTFTAYYQLSTFQNV